MRVVAIYFGDIEDAGKEGWFRMAHVEGTVWISKNSPGRQAKRSPQSQQPLFNDFRIL